MKRGNLNHRGDQADPQDQVRQTGPHEVPASEELQREEGGAGAALVGQQEQKGKGAERKPRPRLLRGRRRPVCEIREVQGAAHPVEADMEGDEGGGEEGDARDVHREGAGGAPEGPAADPGGGQRQKGEGDVQGELPLPAPAGHGGGQPQGVVEPGPCLRPVADEERPIEGPPDPAQGVDGGEQTDGEAAAPLREAIPDGGHGDGDHRPAPEGLEGAGGDEGGERAGGEHKERAGEEKGQAEDVKGEAPVAIREPAHQRHRGDIGDEVSGDDPGGIPEAGGDGDLEVHDHAGEHRADHREVVRGDEDPEGQRPQDPVRGVPGPLSLRAVDLPAHRAPHTIMEVEPFSRPSTSRRTAWGSCRM